MIELNLTEAQLDELHQEASHNPCARSRRKCGVVYLRGKGFACREIADLVRVDADTVTGYARKYRDGGLSGLLAEHYRQPGGRLDRQEATKVKDSHLFLVEESKGQLKNKEK
jgi:transposase